MFQDYCSAHGKPCMVNSLYCSEECRMLDQLQQLQDSGPKNSAPLLYECPFCSDSGPCERHGISLNDSESVSGEADTITSEYDDGELEESNGYYFSPSFRPVEPQPHIFSAPSPYEISAIGAPRGTNTSATNPINSFNSVHGANILETLRELDKFNQMVNHNSNYLSLNYKKWLVNMSPLS